jgi:hypothetical protein
VSLRDGPGVPRQVVGVLLVRNANTAFKNAYGNTPLTLATSAKAQVWENVHVRLRPAAARGEAVGPR